MAGRETDPRGEEGTPDEAWPFGPRNIGLTLPTTGLAAGRQLVDALDPFLIISDRGAFSRVLLAEVTGPTGTGVLQVALKLQSDEYPVLSLDESADWNNRAVEDAWRREIDLLEHCGSLAAGIPFPIEVLPRRAGENAHLPPTLFCKQRRAFFTACCPDCRGPLGDFRDSRALEARGLPRYDRSLVRFLGCEACIAAGRFKLWTLVRGPEGARDEVGDQSDLFRALGAIARSAPSSGNAPTIPCEGCERVPTCHPEDPAARADALRFLTPVTFYESECIALELLHLRYDELSVLMGGAPLRDVVERAPPARRAVLARLETTFANRPRYLFEEGNPRFGLEVLRLKLSLFRQLCGAVATLHRYSRAPHLALTPSAAMVRLSGETSALPNLWSFALSLLGLGNVRTRVVRGGDAAQLAAAPHASPRIVDPVFAAPPLRAVTATEQPCTVTVRRIERESGDRTLVELDVECERIEPTDIGEKDALELNVVQGRPPLALQLLATPIGASGRSLRVRSVATTMDPDLRGRIEQVIDVPLTRARMTVYPCLHVPCDIHSLGKILLVTLLAHAGQTQVQVSQAADAVAERLARFAREHRDSTEAALIDHFIATVRPAVHEGPFDRRQLFDDPERFENAARAISESLWIETLMLGMRAMTTIRGFSVCRTYSDFDPGHPEVQVEHLLELTDALIRQVDAALFGASGDTRVIRQAISRIARELGLESGGKVR